MYLNEWDAVEGLCRDRRVWLLERDWTEEPLLEWVEHRLKQRVELWLPTSWQQLRAQTNVFISFYIWPKKLPLTSAFVAGVKSAKIQTYIIVTSDVNFFIVGTHCCLGTLYLLFITNTFHDYILRIYRHYRIRNCNHFKCSDGLPPSCCAFDDAIHLERGNGIGHLQLHNTSFLVLCNLLYKDAPNKRITYVVRQLQLVFLSSQWILPVFEPRISWFEIDHPTIELNLHFSSGLPIQI